MKTHTILKHTATLLSTAVLLALPARATQNFNKTTSFTTGDSVFGAKATFNAFDNFTKPSGSTLGSYAITAGGTVTGKVFSASVTALSGTGTVTVKSNGAGTFSGNLSALGVSLVNVSNKTLPYSSSHYIKKWSASKSIPFTILLIPCNVTVKVNASVDAFFRVDTTTSSGTFLGGIPRIDMKIGPVADIAASAEASAGVGFSGFASASVGVTGSLKLGKAALTATVGVGPTILVNAQLLQAAVVAAPAPVIPANRAVMIAPAVLSSSGAKVTVTLTADTSGINGSLDVFAQVELFLIGSHRVTKNIAKYSSGPASVNLLGPVTYTWF